MPQVLAVALPTIFGVKGAVALVTAAGALTYAGIGVSLVGSAVLARLAQPDQPAPARPDNIQINSKSAVGARMGHYGRVKVGGNVVFHRAKEGVSYRLIVHSHGQVSNLIQYYLNNEPVTLQEPAGTVADAQYFYYGPRVNILSRMGAVPEEHYTAITSVWPEWTSAHRLDGLSSSLIICRSVPAEEFQRVYPQGEPGLQVLLDGKALADPRGGAPAFSSNMALAIADYVASPDGFNRPDAFDPADIAAQADICDRQVALAEGGAEALYRIGGSYLLNEAPQDVLQRMLDACAGRVRLKPSGKMGLRVGAWVEPEFSIGYSDLLEVSDFNTGPDLLDRYNQLPARFVSEDLGFVEVDAEPWVDQGRIAADGEELIGSARELLFSPSHRQARQVMRIAMERDNPAEQIELVCKPSVLPAIWEDVVTLGIPELGIAGAFEVVRYGLSFEGANLASVQLSLRLVNKAAFSLPLADQGNVQQLPEPDSSAGVPLPETVTAAGAGVQAAANTFIAGVGVAWAAPPSDALEAVLKYRAAGADAFQNVAVGAGVQSVTIEGLVDGSGYDISLAWRTPGGVTGPAVIVENVTAAADATPPGAPAGLAVTDLGDSSALVSMTAAADAGLWKTEIRRDGALVGVVYSAPGEAIGLVDACGAGSFSWSARSVNVSNVPSASDAGPILATIA